MNKPSAGTSAHAPIDVQWVNGLTFEAGREHGPKVRINGDGTTAPSPVDVLLGAIASCASVDVVTILEKQRTPVQALTVRVQADRVDSIPRHLSSVNLHFSIRAPGSTLEKANRAIELSVNKYCSVRASLGAEIPVTWSVQLEA